MLRDNVGGLLIVMFGIELRKRSGGEKSIIIVSLIVLFN